MSQTPALRAYRAVKISDHADCARGNTVHAGHHGGLLALHSVAPPPVRQYDEWLAQRVSGDPRGRRAREFTMTGAKLRRAVVMRRNGCTLRECGASLGCTPRTVLKWLAVLPDDLVVTTTPNGRVGGMA